MVARSALPVEFLSGNDIESALARLIDEYEEFHWAVAWGTSNSLTERVLGSPSKFKAVTFGLAFSQTDPDLVKALIGVPGSFVVTAFPGGTYHPKVYAFRSGAQAAAIVGSANFTNGGLSRNHEASVLITGSADEAPLSDVLAFTARSAELGVGITSDLEARYRLSCRLAARKPRPKRDPLADINQASGKGLMSPLVALTWNQYVRKVRSSAQHNVGRSLDLLHTAQAWLAAVPSFADLTTPQRKALAGVIGRLKSPQTTS
jgi:HKD family nuclease